MEGVCNTLLLWFQPTITKNKQKMTNKCIFSLPIPERERERERSNPSSPSIYHSRASKEASKRCAPLSLINSPRDNTKTHLQERDIEMLKYSENISH
jgi:hypothetical protein